MPGKEVSLEDVYDDPHKYGAPSFEEFCKDPDKYRQRKDHLLAIADDGTKLEGLKKRLGTTYYQIDGYKMDSLEQVESYCLNEGLDMQRDIDFKPFLREGISGKLDMVISYTRKLKGVAIAGT